MIPAMPKHMNIIRMTKRTALYSLDEVLDLMEQPDTDKPVMLNSDDEFEDIQTELVDLQEEMECDGIVADDWEPGVHTGMQYNLAYALSY